MKTNRYRVRTRKDIHNKTGIVTFYLEFHDRVTKSRIKALTRRLDFTGASVKDKDAFLKAETERLKALVKINEAGYQADEWKKDFFSLFKKVMQGKQELNRQNYDYAMRMVKKFMEHKGYNTDVLSFNIIDDFFLTELRQFLISNAIHVNTAHHHYSKITTVINVALKYGLITNYISIKPIPQVPCALKEIITREELLRLWATPCRYKEVKIAFIFSIFSGLRYGDWTTLENRHIKQSADGKHSDFILNKIMVKTGKPVRIFIRPDIIKLLNLSNNPTDKVFPQVSKMSYTTLFHAINEWTERAGIGKHLSTHCGRKTFANLILNHTKRVEVMEKALGHVPNTIGMANYGEVPDDELREATLLEYFDVKFDQPEPDSDTPLMIAA
jgi:integrase